MQGKGKYGGVVLVAIRERDSLPIRVGTASDYKTGREHAQLILRATSTYRSIHIRDKAGRRIATVPKITVGERRLD